MTTTKEETEVRKGELEGQVEAYIDGSYSKNYPEAYGYGIVLVTPDDETELFWGYGDSPAWASMNNVAGELLGAVKAIDIALSNEYTHLTVYHDYEGVGKWADREWAARKPLTQAYVSYVDTARESMGVTFKWVKGHDGDTLNELADDLATKGLAEYKNKGERLDD